MEKLYEGYREFRKTADRDLYGRLSKGQAPHTLVVSCSDSRIIPEAIFSAKPGDLFVLRNVGNVCRLDDPSVACAVEYAVNHLKVRSIVVLAHSDCGAVKDTLDLGCRVYRCKTCGAMKDRDANAACNLRNMGWVTPPANAGACPGRR